MFPNFFPRTEEDRGAMFKWKGYCRYWSIFLEFFLARECLKRLTSKQRTKGSLLIDICFKESLFSPHLWQWSSGLRWRQLERSKTNLVPLMGYYKIGKEKLLVYEYMKWGSLESVLHDRTRKNGGAFLDWASRKKIAIGAAHGLVFLHHSCIPHMIHRDMKSSNVLLDEDFKVRVSDFGMARLVNALDTHLSVSTLAGMPGYVPPEYYQSFRCTTKGDVYSYDVILLELLSGKKPIDPGDFGDDNNLAGWAKQLYREKRGGEILDPEMVTEKSGDVELFPYLKIAFQCLDDRPFKRPKMVQVMAMFKDLQVDTVSTSSRSRKRLLTETPLPKLWTKEGFFEADVNTANCSIFST